MWRAQSCGIASLAEDQLNPFLELVLLSREAAGFTFSGVSVLMAFPCLPHVLVCGALPGDSGTVTIKPPAVTGEKRNNAG